VDRISKVSIYEYCINKYGFIATCKLLKEYEDDEQYEECSIILEAMLLFNRNNKENIPTSYEGCLEMLKEKYEYSEYKSFLQDISEDVKLIKLSVQYGGNSTG